jgi:predicted RNA-binding Zn-ribbon protein involved in translation (DUF1610 family)
LSDTTIQIVTLVALCVLAGSAIAMVVYVIHLRRNNRTVREHDRLWRDRLYTCPSCGALMVQGWAQLGRGIVWAQRRRGRPGGLSSIGDTLPNTQSMHLRMASNMAWRCPKCALVLIDHKKMVN